MGPQVPSGAGVPGAPEARRHRAYAITARLHVPCRDIVPRVAGPGPWTPGVERGGSISGTGAVGDENRGPISVLRSTARGAAWS